MTYGPIDYLVLEFKNEKLKGEIIPTLVELIESNTIRVIDLVIIQKDQDGKHEVVELQELDSETLAVYDPLQAEVTGTHPGGRYRCDCRENGQWHHGRGIAFRKPVGDQIQGSRP